MKTRPVSIEKLRQIYTHPSAILYRYLELKNIYQNTKEVIFKQPSLDLGCGDGKISELLYDERFTYGVDNGEANDLDIALKSGRYRKILLESAEKMSLPDNSVNFVFSNSVIEHIPDNDAVLAEVSRILKTKGKFLFTSPSGFFGEFLYLYDKFMALKLPKLAVAYKKIRNRKLNHYHLYNHIDYTQKLSKYGFKVIRHSYCVSNKALHLWDKMALLCLVMKTISKKGNLIVGNKYYKILDSYYKEGVSKSCGADLLILCEKQ